MSRTRVEFVGREVASRTFGRFVTEWVAAGGTPESLVEGTDCSVEQLLDQDGRISWATYRAIIANARSIWDDEGFVRLGLIVMDSPWARPFTIPARLLYSVKEFYFAMTRPGTDLGIARRMFPCVRFLLHDVGPDHLVMEITMEPGYPPCREFFLITKGSLISIPTMLGFGRSRVEMEEIEGGFRYDIRLPGRGGRPGRPSPRAPLAIHGARRGAGDRRGVRGAPRQPYRAGGGGGPTQAHRGRARRAHRRPRSEERRAGAAQWRAGAFQLHGQP